MVIVSFALSCLLGRTGILFAGQDHQEMTVDNRSLQGILDNELDLSTASLQSKRLIIILSDPSTGDIEAIGASEKGKLIAETRSIKAAEHFRFSPGGALRLFHGDELAAAGITNPEKVTTLELSRLFVAVANGGVLMPGKKTILTRERAQTIQHKLCELVQGKNATIRLARVNGLRTAGAAGHGGNIPVTACFAGYFPAGSPHHVCCVVSEGSEVLPKYNRGALIAAPIFSFVAAKAQRLDLK